LDQAFDRLAFADVGSDLNDSFSRATLIYHGSLVFRTPANQHFYQQLIERLKLPRFVDLNIRQPWFDESQVRTLVAGAKWVKLNIHELNYLADANADPAESKSIQSAIMKFRAKENLTERQTFLVTCGEHGAWWIDEENVFFASSIEIDSFVDSVGAGDAFSSAAIHGILKSQSPKSILQSAVRFAASACEIKGATTQNAGHYARHTELDSIELEPASPAQRDESG
jgi:fructokinase